MSLYHLAKENREQKSLIDLNQIKKYRILNRRVIPKIDSIEIPDADEVESETEEIETGKHAAEEVILSSDAAPAGIGTIRTKSLTETQKDYFNLLTKYIPTESITLYVAFMSAVPAFKKDFTFLTPLLLYWFFAVLTPVILLLWDFGQYKQQVREGYNGKYSFPLWNLIASLIAFMCWALAVPNSPYLTSESGGILAALLALFISTILGLVERIIK